jgi:hypothetical protein
VIPFSAETTDARSPDQFKNVTGGPSLRLSDVSNPALEIRIGVASAIVAEPVAHRIPKIAEHRHSAFIAFTEPPRSVFFG